MKNNKGPWKTLSANVAEKTYWAFYTLCTAKKTNVANRLRELINEDLEKWMSQQEEKQSERLF